MHMHHTKRKTYGHKELEHGEVGLQELLVAFVVLGVDLGDAKLELLHKERGRGRRDREQ